MPEFKVTVTVQPFVVCKLRFVVYHQINKVLVVDTVLRHRPCSCIMCVYIYVCVLAHDLLLSQQSDCNI